MKFFCIDGIEFSSTFSKFSLYKLLFIYKIVNYLMKEFIFESFCFLAAIFAQIKNRWQILYQLFDKKGMLIKNK